MPAPQNISIFLNNALKATPTLAELDSGTALPEVIREMPDEVGGQFVGLDDSAKHEIVTAWKRVMILNSTQVLYTFTYNPDSGKFAARKR